MELSDPKIKKLLIFSQKKSFLIFQETETLKKFFIFQETKLSSISGSNFLISENKKHPTLKNFLIFLEMELLIF